MEAIGPWLGNLHELEWLGREWTGVICILASTVCGAVIGLERERRDKPAGLRTVVLIAVGSTIFTLVSLLLAETKAIADPARLASQILPGIGFLGAGAIIRARGTVTGLTTGATIWSVAAVGVTIGVGFVAGGLFFTAVIIVALTVLGHLDVMVTGRCITRRVSVIFRPNGGKGRVHLQRLLDQYRVPDDQVAVRERSPDQLELQMAVCQRHRDHRAILGDIAELRDVTSIQVEGGSAATG